jgi:tetratricopeptide (TPR) repeat protein
MMTSPHPHRMLPAALIISSLFFVVGCGSSKDTLKPITDKSSFSEQDTRRALSHLVAGELQVAKDQHSQAILEFQDAIKLAPKESALYYATAKSYRALGKSETGLYYGKKAVELDSLNKWYNELLGSLYFDTRDFSKAAEQYDRFALKDPQNPIALQLLAMSQVSDGKLTEALKTYDRLVVLAGLDPDVLYKKLLIQMQLKLDDEAILTIYEMIISDPENLELYQMLGELNVKLGRFNDALQAYNDLLLRSPTDVRALVSICEVYVKKKDWNGFETTVNTLFNNPVFTKDDKLNVGYIYLERADKDSIMLKPSEIVLTRLLKQYPNEWQPHWFLGVIHLRQQQLDKAILSLKNATKLKPDLAQGWENLGIAYLQKNENALAIASFKTGIDKAPAAGFRLRTVYGLTLSQAGRDEEAIATLEEALKYADTDTVLIVQAYSTLGMSYDRLQRFAESEKNYEEALKYDPDNALVLNNLAYSMAERDKELDRSLAMAKIAVQKEPDNGAYLDTIGWIYYKLANYEEARKWIEKAVQSGRESPAVLEHLGDIYQKLGDKKNAVANWQKALELNKTNISLRQKLDANK